MNLYRNLPTLSFNYFDKKKKKMPFTVKVVEVVGGGVFFSQLYFVIRPFLAHSLVFNFLSWSINNRTRDISRSKQPR